MAGSHISTWWKQKQEKWAESNQRGRSQKKGKEKSQWAPGISISLGFELKIWWWVCLNAVAPNSRNDSFITCHCIGYWKYYTAPLRTEYIVSSWLAKAQWPSPSYLMISTDLWWRRKPWHCCQSSEGLRWQMSSFRYKDSYSMSRCCAAQNLILGYCWWKWSCSIPGRPSPAPGTPVAPSGRKLLLSNFDFCQISLSFSFCSKLTFSFSFSSLVFLGMKEKEHRHHLVRRLGKGCG